MALTRDNHFVPQLYLKNFATPFGEVLEYRILVSRSSVPVWKPVNVAGTGYEKNLYTRIVRGEEADDIEQWLNCEYESPAKEPFQKVLAARLRSTVGGGRIATITPGDIGVDHSRQNGSFCRELSSAAIKW